jgi:hypothetical protein
MPSTSKRFRQLKTARHARQTKKMRYAENTIAVEEVVVVYPSEHEVEDEEAEVATTPVPRAGVHWDEASDLEGEDTEEEFEMTEGEDNAELDGNHNPHCG